MINDNLQAFGPNTVGSNLLLNRYMKKEESLFHRIESLLNQQLKRNLEESKIPAAAINLAPSASEDAEEAKDSGNVKRKEEKD